ncbi:MAG: hypothetical protein ABSG55_00820 [Dehalococcoidia bacterium]|jgi:hypothetical protein
MSKAEKEVGTIQGELGQAEKESRKLEDRLASVDAEERVLLGQRLEAERLRWGCDDLEAESTVERIEAALGKLAGQRRGILAQRDVVKLRVDDLNVALDAAQDEVDSERLDEIDEEIGPAEAKFQSLFAERVTLLNRRQNRVATAATAQVERLTELEALGLAEREGFPGGQIRRRITEEVVAHG